MSAVKLIRVWTTFASSWDRLFWIWFGHGIGLICIRMYVVQAGASRKSEVGGGSYELPWGKGVGVCVNLG